MENYNIITLGASGAGKTVFLASLFKQLSLPTDEGIFLELNDLKQQQELNGIYSQVANKESWPIGTSRAVTKWCFTCHVKTQNLEAYPVCQFTYIDYGGGILTDSNEEEGLSDFTFDFRQEIPHADAVIILIDGSQLYKFIQADFDLDDVGVSKWLFNDLPNTIQLASRVKKSPVHFVITKWDLLEIDYDLSKVRECLENKCEEFKRLVEQRVQAGCPVRLIPISSVGNEFVTMQPDGSMKKNLGKVPKPFQLEIPVSYLLIDKVALYRNVINNQDKDFSESAEYKFRFLLDFIPDTLKQSRLLNREERLERLRKVSDTKDALSYLIDTFIKHITEFEENHPQANLGGDMKITELPPEIEKEDKSSTSFACSQEQFVNLTKKLKNWLDKQGYEHQDIKEGDGIIIQIAKKGILRQVTGMSQALNIQLVHRKQNLNVKLSGGKWLDKAGFVTAGTLFFAPLALTAGFGAWQQSRLPKKIIDFISIELN